MNTANGPKNALSEGEEPNIGIFHQAMDETRMPQATPEQLVKLLETQLHLTRAKRTGDATPRRAALLVGGLFIIVAGCCAALLILQQMLSDLQHRAPAAAPGMDAPAGETKNL